MTAEQIAKKYVHGLHDALTDRQEIKDMMIDIETYAENYHQAKLKLLGIGDVVGRSEQLKCEHKGRRTATELVEYCEDCKKILFHP